jgi:hypothetical protein
MNAPEIRPPKLKAGPVHGERAVDHVAARDGPAGAAVARPSAPALIVVSGRYPLLP